AFLPTYPRVASSVLAAGFFAESLCVASAEPTPGPSGHPLPEGEGLASSAIAQPTPMTRHFCTYFDSNFLVKGLTLYRSLVQHVRESFTLSVLCFDDLTYQTLTRLSLPNLKPISLAEFEEGHDDLARAKQNRSRVEYFFTCTPSLPLFLFRRNPDA